MKKRFMNALLLGALVFASTSTFVSCKDYDDDITNLQTKIDKLATAEQLKSEIATLNTAVANAKAEALAKAQEALDKANAAQDAAANAATKEDLAKVKETAEKAQAAAEKAQADLAAAKADLEALIASKADQADLDKANEKIAAAELAIAENKALAEAAQALAESKTDAASALAAAKAEVEAAKEALKELINAKADATTVTAATGRVDKLEAFIGSIEENKTLKEVVDAAVAAAIGETTSDASLASKIAKLEAAVFTMKEDKLVSNITLLQNELKTLQAEAEELQIAYSTMITSVDLFVNTHEQGYGYHKKTFTSVMEKTNVFEAPDGQKIEFKEGRYSVYGDSVIIRVNPVNAVVTKDMVTMLNSQNGEIPGLVIEDVKRYKGLLTSNTRAASDNNGLWVVKFNLDKDYDAEAVDKALYANKKSNEQILYAVAVTPKQANTLTEKVEEGQEAAQRRLVSDYDLRFSVADGTKAKDFTVWTAGMENPTGLWDIRNRFKTTEEAVNTTKREELVWARNDADKGIVTPTVAATADNTVKKADQPDAYGYWPANDKNDDGFVLRSDNRNTCNLFIAEVNEDIVIDYSVYMNSSYQVYGQKVAGFYVTLDKSHAIESKPSELNAWEGYEIDGLNKLIMGSKGTIKVTSPAANGDVIGFRVFAVNLDGTLVDPDGRAFYVQLGKADKQTIGDLNATFDVEKGTFSTGYIDVEGKFAFEDYEHVLVYFNQIETDAAGESWVLPSFEFFDANKKSVGVWNSTNDANQNFWRYTDKSNIKYMVLTINMGRATDFIDNATYKYEIRIVRENEVSTVIRTLDLTMTKVMPTETPGYAYKVAQNELQWVVPYDGDYKIVDGNKDAKIDFFNVLNVEHNAKVWDAATRPDRSQFDITVADGTYAQDVNDNALWKSYSPVIKWIPGDENTMKINNVRSNTVNGKVVVLPYKVDNTTTHAFSATYNFGYISKKYDAASKSYVKGDYKYPVANNPAAMTFCSWTKFFNLKTASEIVNKVEQNPWWKDNYNQLVWKATPAVGDPDAFKKLTLLNWEYKKDAGSRVNDELNPATHGGKTFGALLINGYLTIVKKVGTNVDDIKVMANGAESPYFTAAYDGEGTIEIVQKTNSQRPVAHDETIEFKVEDCFGNQIPVSLPVKVVAKD